MTRGAALIVLAWNRWDLTRRCLESLFASELDAAEVIVVDNASSDGTAEGLAQWQQRLRVVTLPENLGFVRGMNAGIAAARARDDVVLLNNDLVFGQADWLGRLRDAAYATPETGIVGCRLLGPEAEGRVYHVGGFIEPDELHGEQTESGQVERDVGQYRTRRSVQALAFALAYIRRDCLDAIGTLDPAFHSYFEDTDYCLRAADAGIASVLAGDVTLQHDQHGSTADDGGFRARLFAQSRATFAARWQGRLREHYRGAVLWQGPARFPAAPAELARRFVRRLDARSLRMAFTAPAHEVPDTQDRRLEIALRRRLAAQPDVGLACSFDGRFDAVRGRYRVGFASSDWERAPAAWVRSANTLDLLLVPDAFQREAFAAAGVTCPIEVVDPGVDRDYCHTGVPLPTRSAGFVFLAFAASLARDAPDAAAAAFRRAFPRDEPAELLLHVQPGPDAAAIAAALAPHAQADARVHVLNGWGFPWHQRAQLFAAADALVCAGRGGGWTPQPADALACGLQLVATGFGSAGALAHDEGIAVVARRSADPARSGMHWAEPEPDALVDAMRRAYGDPGGAGRQARAAAFARAHDVEASADRLVEALAGGGTLAPARPQPPRHRPVQSGAACSGQIVVLGMHRSGTSGVAGLLARMGVSPGPAADLLEGPDNPRGHYESGRLHMACVRRLAAAGGDWRQPPEGAPASAVDAFRREAGALVDEFDGARPWLFKEPRLCLLARELLPLLTQPVFVHVVRDPQAVAASLAARDGLAPDEALRLWERYTRAAFAASRGWPRVLVDYDALLVDCVAAAQRLHAALAGFGIDGLAMPADDVVRAWIAPNAVHPPRTIVAALTPAQQALQARILDGRILDEWDAADGDGNAGFASPVARNA